MYNQYTLKGAQTLPGVGSSKTAMFVQEMKTKRNTYLSQQAEICDIVWPTNMDPFISFFLFRNPYS